MALKILKSIKKDHSIKMMLHSRLAGWEKPRPAVNIHASDLMKSPEYCPREAVFLAQGLSTKKDSFIGTSLRVTFDYGRFLEDSIRNDWLRDVMVGEWQCGVCGFVHGTFGKVPVIKCPSCGWGGKWKYKETRFLSPESGISGGIDGFVDVGASKLKLLEIKTISSDEFKKIVAPLAEHKFRTALYLKLIEDSDLPDSGRINTQEAHLLYVAKSFGVKDDSIREAGIKDAPFSPFKEFIIKRDDSIADTPIAKATVVSNYLRTQKGMPCGLCKSSLELRAQKCSSSYLCFSSLYPNNVTWLENGVKRHQGKKLVSDIISEPKIIW